MSDLNDVNAVSSAFTEPATVPQMFRHRLAHDPDVTFMLLPDGMSWSYAETASRVGLLADMLAERGVQRGDVVALYMWNEPAWVVAALACWSVGAVVAVCGAGSPLSEAVRRFDLVHPKVVIASDDAPDLDGRPSVRLATDGSVVERRHAVGAPAFEWVEPEPEDAACVFFTSGTTGDPKALVKSHEYFVTNARQTALAYSSSGSFRSRTAPSDKPPALSFNPFGHGAGFGRLVFRLFVGRPVVMMRKFDVDTVALLADTYELDTLQLTPAMVYMLAYAERGIDLGSLRYVNSGTAPLAMATRQAFEDRYGVPVLQAYGSTEGGVTALERYDDALAGRRGPGSVGRITADSEWRIVDESGNDVAPGHEGEILGRPDQRRMITADGEASLPLDAEGWYHSGDVGRLDEHGILYITGRIKEMLIIGGFNVFPAEVEEVLRRSEFVRDVAVVPVADERLGEVAAAALVWEPGKAERRSQSELVAAVAELARRELAAYKVPRHWFSVQDLPLTANGKLDRRSLAAHAEFVARPPADLGAEDGTSP